MTRLLGLLVCASLLVAVAPWVWPDEPKWQGRPVQEVLEAFRQNGLDLIYSTNLVDGDMIVVREPFYRDPELLLKEILEPHGLTLSRDDETYLVVRLESLPDPDTVTPGTAATAAGDGPVELENLTITASRYLLMANSQFFIDQRAIRALPDLGEDPIRSAHRLPGTAAGGLSSRSHFRGGEHNETAIYLNGLKLLDPFHIRDYHSIFSSIDARAVSGVEAYTGGFPASYGDQMSGVLALDTAAAEEPLRTELGLSVYNTSLLNSGHTSEGRIDWLISARDSNLDILLNEDLGKPDYFDVFGELGINMNDDHRLSFNALYADDQVVVVTESDPEELEQSVSDTRNRHFWVTLENQWTPSLSSRTVLSHAELENHREAEVNDPERMVAGVFDRRRARITGFKQDWHYMGHADHSLRWGLEIRREDARYDYRSQAEYHGFFEYYPGIENPAASDIQAKPKGSSYALWLSDRWQLTPLTGIEAGLRWDRQTYTELQYGNQFSPRISLLHSLNRATDLRVTWGRYHQSQAIQELQVEDGQDRFFEPQYADHLIAGIQHRFPSGYRLRLEAYLKRYARLKPRFENLFDPLALIPELAPDRVRLDPSSARAGGIETTLEYRGGGDLDWWISYSWSRATDRIDNRDQRRSWDQRHALQAGLAWQKGPWEVGMALNVHSGWPTTGMDFQVVPGEEPDEGEEEEEDAIVLPVPGTRNAEQLGTFAQIDFRVSREFPVRIGRLSAFFEVTNATNRNNPCCIDYDIDEDDDGNIVLDRTVEHWLPVIPAIGVFWEF